MSEMNEEETKDIIQWFSKNPKHQDSKIIKGYIKGYTGTEATEEDVKTILKGLEVE